MPHSPASLPLSSRLRPAMALAALLAVAGCAAPGEGPRPEVRDAESASAEAPDTAQESVEAPSAPLLPSLLFAGGAQEFQAWRCMPAQDLVSVMANDELRLWSAHGAYRLQPAVVASGSRFQHGDISFWSQGEEARVESANGHLDCSRDATRKTLNRQDRPGVMFHARGNEPGWVANLAHDVPEVSLLLDYGTREMTLPYRVTEMDNAEGRVTLASGLADRPFELRLEARACFDDMSGEPFPARVTLTLEGKTLRGCGQGIAP